MSRINHPVPAETLVRVESLAAEAVAAVTQQIYANHPELLQRFGEKGQTTCREDLHFHLEYLLSALYCADAAPFRDYVLWLASVLESRNVPGEHLMESLRLMQQFFNEHLTPEYAAPVTEVWQSGLDALPGITTVEHSYQRLLPDPLPQSHDYLQSLLDGNRVSAMRILQNSMSKETRLVDIAVGIIQPAMYEIGALWQRNRITVAQEHLATAITQNAMASAFANTDFAAPLNRKALFACVPANHHSLGLRMVSDAFEVTGWNVQFLGADVPAKDLVAQVGLWQPELLGLSLSLPSHIKSARLLVQQLRAELGTQCPAILAGGLASNQADGLWRAVGADLWAANARDCVKEVA